MRRLTILACSFLFAMSSLAQDYFAFKEDFDNNLNHWEEPKTSTVFVKMEKGALLIANQSALDVTSTKAIYIDQARDFRISTSIKAVKMIGNGRLGFIWGMQDYENFYAFEIKGSEFIVYKIVDQQYMEIRNWTRTDVIANRGGENVLEISKKGTRATFYINGKAVFQMPYQTVTGSKMGFIVSKGVTMSVDYLHIKQAPVDVKIAREYRNTGPRVALGSGVNTGAIERSPVLSPDGTKLYFTRENFPEQSGKERRRDIMVAQLQGQEFGEASPLKGVVNNAGDNAVAGILSADNGLLVSETTYTPTAFNVRVGVTKQDGNGAWGAIRPLVIENFYTNTPFTQFSLSEDGKALFISAERDGSLGGRDLYVSFPKDNDQWTSPISLGPSVNTTADETDPFWDPATSTLYFSTQGRPGYGNSDIFMVQRLDATWQKWSEPRNLGPAINTEGHETGFFLSSDKTVAYFSGSDAQLKTSTNIFRVTVPEPAPEEVEQVIAETNTKKMTDEEIAALGTEKVNEQGVLLDLHVFDPLTKIPFREELILVDNSTGEKIATLRPVDGQGHFKTRAQVGKVYSVQSDNKKVILSSKPIDLRERPSSNTINEELPILVTVDGNIVRLRDVVFQFNDVSVQESAKNQLDNFADFMIKYPTVKVEVGGHTDNVGSEEVNMRYSRQRADNVRKYLIEKGVSPQQLTFKGYGKAIPINDNSTEELRLANRRVEFKIREF